jgi:hypothetical protein
VVDRGARFLQESSGHAGSPGLNASAGTLTVRSQATLILQRAAEDASSVQGTDTQVEWQRGAKQIPSWASGNRPYVGENGRDFAERLMDQQYGRGNWNRTDPEYNQLKKFGDRNFRDPRSMLLPDNDQI